MIDWIEHVLKAAEPEAEQDRLLSLMAQMTGAIKVLPETRLIREKAGGTLTEGQEKLPPRTELFADKKEVLREEPIGWEKRPAIESLREQGKSSDLIRDAGMMEGSWRSVDAETTSYPDGMDADPVQPEREVWKLPNDAATGSGLLHGRRENMGDGVLAERIWQTMEQTLPDGTRRGGAASSALRSLYRYTAEAIQMTQRGARSADPVTFREERTIKAGITVRELDRAVRRDSRRYDGGMNIY